jgi:flagellar M-ring protein FliF
MHNGFGQVGQQLHAIWKQLGLNQRVSLILAGLVVVAGLGSLILWSGQAEYS